MWAAEADFEGMSPRKAAAARWRNAGQVALGHGAPGSSGSSASSSRTADRCVDVQLVQHKTFAEVARFWKGAEASQAGVPIIIPPSQRPWRVGNQRGERFGGVTTSISTLSGSGGGSAKSESGLDSPTSFNCRWHSASSDVDDVARWAYSVHLGQLRAPEDDCVSCYSHASAVDMGEIDIELGLIPELPLEAVSAEANSEYVGQSPPLPPELPMEEAQEDAEVGVGTGMDDSMSDLRLDNVVVEPSKFSGQRFEGIAPEITDAASSMSVCDDEDNLGSDGRHIYGSLGRQCSFAESFARRKMVGPRVARNQASSDLPSTAGTGAVAYLRDFCKTDSRAGARGTVGKEVGSRVMDRAAHALAELLDQKRTAANRLTEGTRAFSSLFSADEKEVLEIVIRAACVLIRLETRKDGKSKLPSKKLDVTMAEGGGQLVLHRKESAVAGAKKDRRSAESGPDAVVAQRVMLGTVSKSLTVAGEAGARNAHAAGIMLITDGTVKGRAKHKDGVRMVPRGPLARQIDNECIDVQLSFASALISVLAVMARLDCELICKRRKNRMVDANNPRDQSVATVNVRARQDRSGRHFTFCVVVTGSSPARISFRRPRFIALRRVDDYVDIVLDSKELLTEYCHAMWGRA
jgi:hypothetical protein